MVGHLAFSENDLKISDNDSLYCSNLGDASISKLVHHWGESKIYIRINKCLGATIPCLPYTIIVNVVHLDIYYCLRYHTIPSTITPMWP